MHDHSPPLGSGGIISLWEEREGKRRGGKEEKRGKEGKEKGGRGGKRRERICH